MAGNVKFWMYRRRRGDVRNRRHIQSSLEALRSSNTDISLSTISAAVVRDRSLSQDTIELYDMQPVRQPRSARSFERNPGLEWGIDGAMDIKDEEGELTEVSRRNISEPSGLEEKKELAA